MEFTQKRRHPENIVVRLLNRERYGSRKAGTQLHTVRQFYQNIFPNFTVINVEKPPCFLRKFSPDGKCFIAFSADQTSLEVYSYQGPAAAADLLQNIGNYDTLSISIQNDIKSRIFERFFKHLINITTTEQLNRECSLFSDDGRYVIVGSASYIPEEMRPTFYEIYTNNESVTPTIRSPLEDYTLHLVDLHLGKLCDIRNFKIDKIFLSHNQGLYLYKDTLAVLSVQHQMIHIFQILDGMFVDVRKIGRFCYEDDLYLYNSVYPSEAAFKDVYINSLKHRLLTFLYKRASNISESTGDPTELRKFYLHFDNFNSLKMWKMQLLDENHLLIKYASEEIVTLKQTDANSSEPQFFIVYNINSSKVIAVYENSSKELVNLYENFCDSFRNACLYS
ncbi:DET1 homolog isoform X2 [Sitophilus oryzae]|uniref:DET1 homolog isoform X2 n=1 Tax=Sitophilus oryzae TaxID=7048 RepID=A0A6J2XFE5_SITOR|nr:DET1 homolog isoform X2 [Sitophilus oryzae]